MTLVGIAATLIRPHHPRWVRVSLTDTPNILLSGTDELVPEDIGESTEEDVIGWLHRLVAGEAVRREVLHLESRRAPASADWIRMADRYMHRFRGIPRPSAMAREVLFEKLVRDVRLRFYFMVRRLRKAASRLEEHGFLSNRELDELWAAFSMAVERCKDERRLIEDDVMPEHLKSESHPTPRRA